MIKITTYDGSIIANASIDLLFAKISIGKNFTIIGGTISPLPPNGGMNYVLSKDSADNPVWLLIDTFTSENIPGDEKRVVFALKKAVDFVDSFKKISSTSDELATDENFYTAKKVKDLIESATGSIDIPNIDTTNLVKVSDFSAHINDAVKHLNATEHAALTNLLLWWKLDANGNLYTDKNLYSNQGVSAYGMGASSGGGTVSVYDGLDSTSTTLALSANQGRILKAQIDALGTGGSGSISESDPIWSAQKQGYYTKSEVDSLISGVSGGGEGTTVSWGTEASGYVPLSVAGTSKNISLATHTHAWNDIANKPNTFTPTAHTHSISQISNLQLALDGKAALSHTHTVSDIQYFPTTWDWNNIDGKPSIYPPAAHTHTFASLTSKPTTLSGYGITDAVTLTTEQTISGAKTFTSAVNFGNGFSLETSTDELLLKHNGSIRHRFGKNGDILALADITAYSGNATASSRLEMSGDLDMNGHWVLSAKINAKEVKVFGGEEHSYLYVGDENLSIYNNDYTGENRIDMGAVILSSKNGIGQVFSNQLIFRQGTIDKFMMYTESDRLYIKFGNTPIGYFQSSGIYSSI